MSLSVRRATPTRMRSPNVGTCLSSSIPGFHCRWREDLCARSDDVLQRAMSFLALQHCLRPTLVVRIMWNAFCVTRSMTDREPALLWGPLNTRNFAKIELVTQFVLPARFPCTPTIAGEILSAHRTSRIWLLSKSDLHTTEMLGRIALHFALQFGVTGLLAKMC
jgi:hypothetical protein